MSKSDVRNALIVGSAMAFFGYTTPLLIVSAAVGATTMAITTAAEVKPALAMMLTMGAPAMFWGAVGTFGSLICTHRPAARRPIP